MSLDKLKQAWKSEARELKVTFDSDSLSKEVWQSRENLRSIIFWRDVREVGSALLMIPLWFVLGSIIPVPWTWWLTVPIVLWIAGFMLVDRKRHPQRPSGPGEPLLFYVREYLSHIEHQIWLLRNVFWWYLLPLSVALMAFFLHSSWNSSNSWLGFAIAASGYTLIVTLLCGWIFRLNQQAVREQLEPRRQQLVKLIASLESDNISVESGDIMEIVASLAEADQDANLQNSFAAWSENWNRIIPTWSMVAIILGPTLIAAYCGYRFALQDFGPVFFQSVVAFVITFEIMFFGRWYLTAKCYKNQPLRGTCRASPEAPAIFMIVMILVVGALAVAGLTSVVGQR